MPANTRPFKNAFLHFPFFLLCPSLKGRLFLALSLALCAPTKSQCPRGRSFLHFVILSRFCRVAWRQRHCGRPIVGRRWSVLFFVVFVAVCRLQILTNEKKARSKVHNKRGANKAASARHKKVEPHPPPWRPVLAEEPTFVGRSAAPTFCVCTFFATGAASLVVCFSVNIFIYSFFTFFYVIGRRSAFCVHCLARPLGVSLWDTRSIPSFTKNKKRKNKKRKKREGKSRRATATR